MLNQSETERMFIELDLPPDGSNVGAYIEDYLNISSLKCIFCEDACQKLCQKEQRSRITNSIETEFLTIMLTRAVETLDGKTFLKNKIVSTNDVYIR